MTYHPTEDELLDADVAAADAADDATDYAVDYARSRGQDPWGAALRVRRASAATLLADRPF